MTRARAAASSACASARSQAHSGGSARAARRIWAAFRPRPKAARQVPWCGVPSVIRRATRWVPQARIQARATSPPMLCATMITRSAPVAVLSASTARSTSGA